jgi:hypothetical protein
MTGAGNGPPAPSQITVSPCNRDFLALVLDEGL